MRVSISESFNNEERRLLARQIDGKDYDGKRKATREELEGAMRDGAEYAINERIYQAEQMQKAYDQTE